MESRKLASQIHACFPQIPAKEYRRISSGWENHVLEVDGKYIFRFPRLPRRWARLQRELALLRYLKSQLSSAVPDYEFVWQGSEKRPQKLAGYRKIAGVPCTQEEFRTEKVARLSKDVGTFLTELHGIRLPHQVQSLVPRHDQDSWANRGPRFYRAARKFAYPLLDDETQKRADSFWTEYLDHFSNIEFEPALTHSDVTLGNMIVDPSTGGLNGVIDWGDAKVADPALDFVGVFEVSRPLGEGVLANYRRKKDGFMERIELYSISSSFGDVAWGARTGDQRPVRSGLRHIRQRLA